MSDGAGKKVTMWVLCAIVAWAILFWDVIPGRAEFDRLCQTSSGIRVHKKVLLDPNEPRLEFPDSFLQYEQLALAKRYPYRVEDTDDLPGPARIKRRRDTVIDSRTGEELGSLTIYYYGGGWLENALSTAGTGGGACGIGAGGTAALLNGIFEYKRN
jgi:hypothetical protein